jgi:hypothetical protein
MILFGSQSQQQAVQSQMTNMEYVPLSLIYHCIFFTQYSNIFFDSQPQQQTGMGYAYTPIPQQGFVPNQGLVVQQAPVNLPPPHQFYSSVPLAVLGEGSAPADCPLCRHRTMTMTSNHAGNTTQYVHQHFYTLFHFSMPQYSMLLCHIVCAPSVSVFLLASSHLSPT